MVASKKKKASDPSAALYALLEEPGTPDDIWDDLLGNISDDPWERFGRALAGQPRYDDRAAAIVFAALLDHSLEIAIGSVFASSPQRTKRLFSYQHRGPLATFSARIQIGDALGLYEEQMLADLQLIALIRNVFAHARVPVDFLHERIIAGCNALKITSNLAQKPWSVGHRSKSWHPHLWTARQKYTGAIAVMTNFLGLVPQLPVSDQAMLANYALMYRTTIPLPRKS